MYSCIVKIKSGDTYGTGILLSKKEVLTASHVVKNEDFVTITYKNESYYGKLFETNDNIALIRIDNEFIPFSNELFFTLDEILDSNSNWEVYGFVSGQQEEHHIKGNGVHEGKDYYVLDKIQIGKLGNYKGLSGSPVICNNRIVGILQVQAWYDFCELGLRFTHVDSFRNLLPSEVIKPIKYIEELHCYCKNNCNDEIEKNKKIKKYIKEIYVEEGFYKDYLRIFAEPVLFFNKIIDELNTIDFLKINAYLSEIKSSREKVDFSKFKNTLPCDLQKNYDALCADLSEILKVFEDYSCHNEINKLCLEDYCSQITLFSISLKYKIESMLSRLKFISCKMILLTKNAGQGKTNFLCDFTENFLMKKHCLSLYFNATDFIELPYNKIIDMLTLDKKWEKNYAIKALEKHCKNTGKPIIIVIDGLNENAIRNFGKYVENTFNYFVGYNFIKLIATTRNENFEDRFPELTEENLGKHFIRENMSLIEHNTLFNDRIFWGYLSHFNVNLNAVSDSAYEMLASDTLLLRFFCEVYKDQQLDVYDIYKYDLFHRYYEQKKEQIKQAGCELCMFDKIIMNISEYMLENGKFNKIPKIRFQMAEIEFIDRLLSEDIIFKEDVEAKEGLLIKKSETISFTFDEFRDFCLTNYILNKKDAVTSLPIMWNNIHLNNWPIAEGIEKYTFSLGKTINPDILSLISETDSYQRVYWENIWNVEEKYITDEDICKWKQQFLLEDKYRSRISAYLIGRYDCTYFKKINIELFFGILDEIADMPDKYYKLINLLFHDTRKNKSEMIIEREGCICYCDELMDYMDKLIVDVNLKRKKERKLKTFLNLTLYIYEIMPDKILELWFKISKKEPNIAIEILKKYLSRKHVGLCVAMSINEIIQAIDLSTNGVDIDLAKFKISILSDFNDVCEKIDQIWS